MINFWPSPAKINLFLYIIDAKKNGYHNLQTLFQFIDYNDFLYFKINNFNDIKIINNHFNIKKKDNLIFKAASLLIKKAISFDKISKKTGVFIIVNKRIPLKSGLGGGSSNAATTLLVLNKILKINFTFDQLALIGLTIGADIPFFIRGHSAFAEGIGEKLKFINLIKKWYLIIHPNIGISTKDIFNDPEIKINTKKNYKNLISNPFKNDCEFIAKKNHLFKKYILSLLRYAPFRMTGTGDCIFSEFDTKNEAYKVLYKLPIWVKKFFIVKGVNISPLHNILNSY